MNFAKSVKTRFLQNISGRLLGVIVMIMGRSSRPEVSVKKGFLRNFANLTGKRL